jgi:chemotaxis-related protein WspB
MLLLLFQANENIYAIDSRRVVEVIPRVALRPLPHAPAYLLGLLSYRGKVVPVVDFGILIGGDPCSPALSSRIIVTEFTSALNVTQVIGLLAEQVSRVVDGSQCQVIAQAMEMEHAPYLGEVRRSGEGLIQVVVPDKLLSSRMQQGLYGTGEESA